ncbi:MAG: hypothetical protein Q8R47_05760 [Nanoarchaeota archaeon]|nr:hypothetical protein [Nanoarchaeota archaeon]
MIDYQNAANEMKAAEKRIKDNFVELGTFDYQRAEHFYDYFKHNRREDLERFLKKTVASRAPLHSIRKDFRKIIGCLSVVEKNAHKNHNFKVLLKRVKHMQKLLGDFFKLRRTQIKACRSLLRTETVQNPVLNRVYEGYKKCICKIQEKRLILSFGKERDLVILFEGFFKQERERVDAAFQTYLNEKNKNLSMTEAPLAVVVLMPAVGTSLALAVHAAFQWANRHGSNHKLLVKPSSSEGRNGTAV